MREENWGSGSMESYHQGRQHIPEGVTESGLKILANICNQPDNPLQYSCLENPMDKGEPGRLQPMGSQSVGHNSANNT